MHKKILLLTTPFRPNIGGVETHLDDLIKEGAKQGLKFDVVTYQPLITKARGKTIEEGKGFVVYRIPWIRNNLFLKLEPYPILEFLYLFPPLFIFGFVYLLSQSRKIFVIHGQGLIAGSVGVVLGKIFSKRTLISTHSVYHFPAKGLYPAFVRLLFNNAFKVLVLSEQSRKEVLSLGIMPDKVAKFTYWVDQKIFIPRSKLQSRKRLDLPRDAFIALFVGRLVAVKGVRELLNAARISGREIVYLIIGDGPMAIQVARFAEKHKNIIFVGRVDNNKLPEYYSNADVILVPSTHEEGFGRVILESLSCGTPVVAANRGGIPEAVDSSVSVLIDISPRAIKETLESLWRDRKKLERLAKNARNFAEKHFSERNVRMITKFYG